MRWGGWIVQPLNMTPLGESPRSESGVKPTGRQLNRRQSAVGQGDISVSRDFTETEEPSEPALFWAK